MLILVLCCGGQAQLEKQSRRVKELEDRLLKETRLGERLNNELSILKVITLSEIN